MMVTWNQLLQATDIPPVDESGKGEVVSHSTIATGPGTSFKQLAQMNSDSDDDLPLSELSSISGESGTNKKRVRLDSPPPPPPPAPPSAHSKRRGVSTSFALVRRHSNHWMLCALEESCCQ
jgi:hypothetical protein